MTVPGLEDKLGESMATQIVKMTSLRILHFTAKTWCLVYKYTNEDRYLNASRWLATYFVDNIPSNGIVPW